MGISRPLFPDTDITYMFPLLTRYIKGLIHVFSFITHSSYIQATSYPSATMSNNNSNSNKMSESIVYFEVENPENNPKKSKFNQQAVVKYLLIFLAFLILSKLYSLSIIYYLNVCN